jgi:hypothetical protein
MKNTMPRNLPQSKTIFKKKKHHLTGTKNKNHNLLADLPEIGIPEISEDVKKRKKAIAGFSRNCLRMQKPPAMQLRVDGRQENGVRVNDHAYDVGWNRVLLDGNDDDVPQADTQCPPHHPVQAAQMETNVRRPALSHRLAATPPPHRSQNLWARWAHRTHGGFQITETCERRRHGRN